MSPDQFKQEIDRLQDEFKALFAKYAPTIAGKTAVSYFKKNFQNEAWGRVRWQEVKRRTPGTAAYKSASRHHTARTTRPGIASQATKL